MSTVPMNEFGSETAGADSGAGSALPKLDMKPNPLTAVLFLGTLGLGLAFTAYSLGTDITAAHALSTSWVSFALLGTALAIALCFEFVNGFHDTANAVATVIYTHAMPPALAVVWSGFFNFLGVLLSSGAVAYGIISLLPVELILQVSSGAGFSMVFALLIAAIIWNLGTWFIGLPASSSHTMIGSIMGVGLANQFMHTATNVSGVDWAQATKIFTALFWSPILGFGFAALMLLAMKALIKVPALYEEPKGDAPPPPWIRALLVLTCTGVSFSHGSNDGQKGMGLIMLILIGTVPTAYALNRALPIPETTAFYSNAKATQAALDRFDNHAPAPADPRAAIKAYVQTKKLTPDTVPALAAMAGHLGDDVKHYGDLAKVPASAVTNTRNDMYLTSEAIRLIGKAKNPKFDAATDKAVQQFGKSLDKSTKYIPLWVKIVVAIALGLGTMVGWKRIVKTVGEKIGKTHLTYAQGASAELVTAILIAGADNFGLPVSTTHVLSSGVAGAMTANGSGVQIKTMRNIAMAWVLTLPIAMLLSGSLYVVFSKLFG